MHRPVFGIALWIFVLQAPPIMLGADPTPVQAAEVGRLLQTNCAACHSEKTKTSGFSVANLESVVVGGNKYGKAVVEGHPEQSPLIRILKGELQPQMPMGKPLATAEIVRVEEWIRQLPPSKAETAEWRWPFEKPVKHQLPSVKNVAWVKNPIDAFIVHNLRSKG